MSRISQHNENCTRGMVRVIASRIGEGRERLAESLRARIRQSEKLPSGTLPVGDGLPRTLGWQWHSDS